MNQVVFVILSVIFLKVIEGQPTLACQRAEQNLAENQLCVNASMEASNATLVCNGTCRSLYDDVIDECGEATSNSEIQGLVAAYNTTCLSGAECRTALTAWHTNTICTNAVNTDDTTTYCSGTCLELIDDIINSCPSIDFANEISATCVNVANARCEAAANAVNASCLLLLNTANPTVCFGMCGNQVASAAYACASISDSEIQEFVSAYNTACRSVTQCEATLTAWNANAACIDAVNNDNKTIYCSGTCGELLNDVVTTCPRNDFLSSYNQNCGFVSAAADDCNDGSLLQASGTIILLILAAMCGLIF